MYITHRPTNILAHMSEWAEWCLVILQKTEEICFVLKTNEIVL